MTIGGVMGTGKFGEQRRADSVERIGHPKRYTLFTPLCAIFLFCALSALCSPLAFANNLTVQNVNLYAGSDGNHATIQFDISQENSWRYNATLYDAAWVFVKYSVDGGVWQHATLSSVDTSAINGTNLAATLPADQKGAFLYRAAGAEGKGTLSAAGVKFQWAITYSTIDPQAHNIKLKVFALEMVHIPQGDFYVGSGGAETSAFYKYPVPADPFLIGGEWEILVGASDGDLYYDASTYGGDQAGPIPGAFPKGYNAFFIMKYELTQGQYRDFLNTLTRAQQATRVATPIGSGTTSVAQRYVMSGTLTLQYRNGIRCDGTIHTSNPITFYCDLNGNGIPNEATDGEFIAANWLNWADVAAYADWAGLRPMTELEFEKAARGPANPVANEYAWGTAGITATASGPTNPGANNEIAANGANCLYSGGVAGPMRSGFAATSASLRYDAGASFYGVLELSGNVIERPVTVGDATGRLFTGLSGDGVLDASGNANVSFWPGTSASGAGLRGGGFNNSSTNDRISDRIYAAFSASGRSVDRGARLARTE